MRIRVAPSQLSGDIDGLVRSSGCGLPTRSKRAWIDWVRIHYFDVDSNHHPSPATVVRVGWTPLWDGSSHVRAPRKSAHRPHLKIPVQVKWAHRDDPFRMVWKIIKKREEKRSIEPKFRMFLGRQWSEHSFDPRESSLLGDQKTAIEVEQYKYGLQDRFNSLNGS